MAMKVSNMFFCVQFLWLSASLFSCYGRGGGDAALGGFAGGMFGGLMSGAMTRDSGHRRSSDVSISVIREIDKLENAVRYDLLKLDGRINVLERNAGDSEAVLQEITDTKKSLKKIEARFEDKFSELEELITNLAKKVKDLQKMILLKKML